MQCLMQCLRVVLLRSGQYVPCVRIKVKDLHIEHVIMLRIVSCPAVLHTALGHQGAWNDELSLFPPIAPQQKRLTTLGRSYVCSLE
jgi:hypothetical protein